MQAGSGGRVTELTARPLLNLFYPELSGVIQPLSGEYAGRRDALENAVFYSGYGVEIGLLIDGFDCLPALMMPWNFPYYMKLVEANGYVKEKDLLSMRIYKTDPLSPKIERLAQRIRKKTKVTVRPFYKNHFWNDLRLMIEIYHDAWSDNWGFVPLSENEIKEMGRNLKRAIEPDMIFFINYADEPVGVGMALPDFNPLLKEFNGVIKPVGVFKYLFRVFLY